REGVLRREDQGAERESRRTARPGAGRAGRRGADGLRRSAGAQGARWHRRRARQPLSPMRLARSLATICPLFALMLPAVTGGARGAETTAEPIAVMQGLDKITARA